MSVSTSLRICHLIDARAMGRPFVLADVYRDYPPDEFQRIEARWAAARERAAEEHAAAGLVASEQSPWDWRDKAHGVEAGRHLLVAVEYRGEAQGIMAVLRAPRPSPFSESMVLYVEYLESAPWNHESESAPPRLLGVGTVLLAEAVHISREMGLDGRIGLHALPQSEIFYRSRSGMTEFGNDVDCFDLTYFEFTGQQATDWLATIGEA